jgi:dTDP-4-amino-4,6-dideoxygalactose transaminase
MPALKAIPAARPADEPVVIGRPRLPTLDAIAPYLAGIDAARRYANFGPLNAELEGRLAERDCPRAALPHTERLAEATPGLPYYVDLSAANSARVADALMEALRHG